MPQHGTCVRAVVTGQSQPTYSPWLNPIEMLWRHFRREVTHCECFPTKQALLAAAQDFFARRNRQPHTILSVIGSKAINPI